MSPLKSPYIKRINSLTLLVGVITALACGAALRQQYHFFLEKRINASRELTDSCGEFLESVVPLDEVLSSQTATDDLARLEKAIQARPHFLSYASRGEFLLAGRDGEGIRVLPLSFRGVGQSREYLESWQIPAERALMGQSGDMNLEDNQGHSWMAVYRPVAGGRWGLVGRIDRTEVREPFLVTGAMVIIISLLAVLLGGYLFRRMVDPMLADLADREKRYRTMADASVAGISITDQEMRVTFVNPALEQMLGYSPGELIGIHLSQVATGQQLAEFEKNTQNRLQGEGRSRYEASLVRRDGVEIPVMISAAALLDERGGFQGTLAVAVDISEQKRTENELLKLKEAAEVASEAKSEFLANISHELRSPLHVILGFAQQGMRRGEKAERERLINYFSRIHSSGDLLLHTVNELLDLSRLDAGRMQFEFGATSMNSLVSTVVDECISLFSARGIHVEFQEPEEKISLEADGDRLKQVLRNLLSNAAKFSAPDSTVIVTLDCHEGEARVRVQDSGPGVPPEELDLIFQKFIQSSRTKSGAGGTGLGLAICREIITAHQGRISAANAAEGGAVFTFSLPRQRLIHLEADKALAIAPLTS